ncbi:hypothetical protein AAEX37_00389 [Oligella sp. MSHR50489EDL]|uniref:hypothetical protein n=1 Tax=Oligella sp. MSHR50489EDL TaxID=3139409 RepID=UPI003D815D46
MSVREKKNKSGSVSIQVVSKKNGTYKVLKSIGCATTRPDIERFKLEAEQYIEDNKPQLSFDFEFTRAEEDEQAVTVVSSLHNNKIHVIGPELIFGNPDYVSNSNGATQ